MTFRDDREALLARAEALEYEASRLRRENEELRACGVRTSGRAEVEKLAARTRAAQAGQTARALRPTTRFTHLLDESLSPVWSKVAWGAAIVAVLPLFIGFVISLDTILAWFDTSPEELGWLAFGLLGGWLVVSLLGGYLLRLWVIHIEARDERRKLAALPFPLDLAGYFAVLATAQTRKALEVRVTFTDAHAEEIRRTIVDAVRGAVPEIAAVQWRGEELVIASPELDTLFAGGRGPDWHDNVELHRWFRQLARDALSPIARAFPMTIVRVQ